MAKSKKGYDTSFLCYQPELDDYVFIPTLNLNTNYVVGDNISYPVTYYDSPVHRRELYASRNREKLNARLADGENLYPRQLPVEHRPSFDVTDRARFSFGYVTYTRIAQPSFPGEIHVYHNYDDRPNYRVGDDVEIKLHGSISGVFKNPIGIVL